MTSLTYNTSHLLKVIALTLMLAAMAMTLISQTATKPASMTNRDVSSGSPQLFWKKFRIVYAKIARFNLLIKERP